MSIAIDNAVTASSALTIKLSFFSTALIKFSISNASGSLPFDFSTENLYGYDLNLDDYDTDPNNDNYSFNNISGSENNNGVHVNPIEDK